MRGLVRKMTDLRWGARRTSKWSKAALTASPSAVWSRTGLDTFRWRRAPLKYRSWDRSHAAFVLTDRLWPEMRYW